MLLAALWRREDTRYLAPGLSLSFTLLTLSPMIRFKPFLLIALVMIPLAVYLYRKGKTRPVRLAVLAVLLLAGLMTASTLGFQRAYYSNPAWTASLQFYERFRGFYDFRNPVYNPATKPVFDSVGWTANDLALFRNFYLMDPGTFSDSKIGALSAHFSQFDFAKNPSDTFQEAVANSRTRLLLLFLLAIAFFLQTEAWGFMAVSVGWTALVLLGCYWLLKFPERVYLPCLFAQNCLGLFFVVPKNPAGDWKNPRFSAASKMGSALLVLFLIYSAWIMDGLYAKNRFLIWRERELKDIMASLNPQDNQLYVVWGTVFPFQEVGAFDDPGFLRHFNILSLSWFQWAPATQDMMDRFGLKDFSRDIVDNPHVRLICAPAQFSLYQTHMREKYHLEVAPQVIFTSNQFPVIAVRSVHGK
jgi:hypothetical protein